MASINYKRVTCFLSQFGINLFFVNARAHVYGDCESGVLNSKQSGGVAEEEDELGTVGLLGRIDTVDRTCLGPGGASTSAGSGPLFLLRGGWSRRLCVVVAAAPWLRPPPPRA